MSVLRAPIRVRISDRYIDRIGEMGAKKRPAPTPEPSLLDLAELEWEREIEKQRKR